MKINIVIFLSKKNSTHSRKTSHSPFFFHHPPLQKKFNCNSFIFLTEQRKSYGGCYPLAKAIVFNKVKKKLGIQKCKTITCGAAPLALDVKHYFASLDILIMDAFGMSECSALHCCNVPDEFKFDSAGKACSGMSTMIDKPDKDEQGEV